MLDKEAVINIVKQYADVVTKEFSPSAIVLFGSYVNGNPHEDSDIDVGVVFNGFTGDRLQTSSRLWRLCRDISMDLEPHFLDSEKDFLGFVKFVLKTGLIVYQA